MRRGARWLLTSALALIGTLGAAPAASGSFVEVVYTPGRPADAVGAYPPTESLVARGEGEEANVLTAVDESRRTIVITDTGASLQPGAGCTSIDRTRVRCSFRLGDPLSISFEGGDGDDTVDLSSVRRSLEFPNAVGLYGGSGADILKTSPLGGFANGGPGPDRLIGGAGPDTFNDSDAAERDEFDGGGGINRINYYTRAEGISIDLAAEIGGAPGENDSLVGFTEASGGDGADDLRGTGGPDNLNGGEGTDRVEGRSGDDELNGGATPERGTYDVVIGGDGDDLLAAAPIGRATLDGGPGDDRIVGGSGRDEMLGGEGADELSLGGDGDIVDAGPGDDGVTVSGLPARMLCGPGLDFVKSFDPFIRPPDDCELMRVNDGLQATRRVRIRGRHALLRLYCSHRNGCRGGVRLDLGYPQRPVRAASVRFRVRRGGSRGVRLALSRRALRRYRARDRLKFSAKVVWLRRAPYLGTFTNQVRWTVIARR